jgi:DNA polymerase III epsilon subunit-like protein
MSWIVVDVEADGQAPGIYSMVCFGAVIVEDGLTKTFYGKTKPITDKYEEEALAISGFSREEHEGFDDPKEVMEAFEKWVLENSVGKPVFISDNNGFDWSFINYYFHRYLERNPFGWSSRRIGDLYCGMKGDTFARWKHLRESVHDHNPVNDAKGNAEAILKMRDMGLKVPKTRVK